MGFEDQLNKNIFSQTAEKTFIDKVLAREESYKLEKLAMKTPLSRADALQILYLLSSVETKLVNFGDWDRYIQLKFFVWVREFVKLFENVLDQVEDLEAREKKGRIKISSRTKKLIMNIRRHIEHDVKFLVDIYLSMMRSTLSLNGAAILEILRNKYEITYAGLQEKPTKPEKEKTQILQVKK